MTTEDIVNRIKPSEIVFFTSRSSGPGGQNVNKVNTKVELRFNIPSSDAFSAEEKESIMQKLYKRINKDGELLIVSQSERTQLQNKKKAEDILYRLLAKALTVNPPRKRTRPTTASKIRRVKAKKKRGAIKTLRKDPESND